jgi:hypothetical protein
MAALGTLAINALSACMKFGASATRASATSRFGVNFRKQPTVEAVALDSETKAGGDKFRLLAGSLLLGCRGYCGWFNTLSLKGARELVKGQAEYLGRCLELSWVETRNPLSLRVEHIHSA